MTTLTNVTQGQRRLPLTGAVNFRDLGGYATVDGKVTAWRRLFRSDSLAELTQADVDQIAALGLRRIFDLRAPEERLIKPNRLPVSELTGLHEPGFALNRTDDLLEMLKQKTLSADRVVAFMTNIYRQALIEDIDYFRNAFDLFLRSNEFPALVHCTSGKDRTGLFVMIIFLIIGIPRETIITDYKLTNQFQRDISFMFQSGVNPEALNAVRSARQEFLTASFDTIDNIWGGEEVFLSKGLELTSDHRDMLKEQLLVG
jgi:protein-tyrosine phosphatase